MNKFNEPTSFFNYVIKKHPTEVYGSYEIFDDQERSLGSSRGFTIKRRYFSFISSLCNTKYIIAKGDNKIYFILKDDDIEATLQLNSRTNIILTCKDEIQYAFESKSFGAVYEIKSRKGAVGIISCNNWINEDVGLSVKNNIDIVYILGAIVAMGYENNSNTLTRLTSSQ